MLRDCLGELLSNVIQVRRTSKYLSPRVMAAKFAMNDVPSSDKRYSLLPARPGT